MSEVILCERDGVYGRLKREIAGSFEEVIDVTEICRAEAAELAHDWTEVVLFGNRADQNTVKDPYDSNPQVIGQWLADYLYHRFFRLPPGLTIRLLPGTHKLDGARTFRTIPDRAYPMGRSESVHVAGGLIVHYFYDPPWKNTSHNASISGSITTDVSTCALVHKDEIFDLERGRQWSLDAPMFGVTFGAKHISIHIDIPDDYSVRPEAYRQFLRYREGEQAQVSVRDFVEVVRDNRPTWLREIINSFSPSDSTSTKQIRDELQELLNSLRVKTKSPRLDPKGTIAVEAGPGAGARAAAEGNRKGTGTEPGIFADDVLVLATGAKRASVSLNSERVPEIIPLRTEEEIDEKGMSGKAGKFYPEAAQLFINMLYPAVAEMRRQLEAEYAAAVDPEAMRRMALELAEKTMIVRVGRAVVFALAKQANREWSSEDIARAESPESLSLAADDYADSLQNVRRKMGQALRTGRKDSEAVAAE